MGASPKARPPSGGVVQGKSGGGGGGCGIRNNRTAVVTLLLTLNLFEAMNGTLTGLLIPVFAEAFHCSTEVAAWTQLGPQFTSAMMGPPIGMVADTIGRTTVWRVFVSCLVIALPVCGFSTSVFMLIAARTVSGLSWAGCGPAGFAIMAQGIEPSRRGIISAWQQATGMFGGSCGTALGGILISVMGWRYVFFFSMVPATTIWLLSFPILPRDAPMSRAELVEKIKTFDWWGTLLFIVCIGSALLLINRGNDLGWTSAFVMGCAITFVVTFPLLIVFERRALRPILPLSLLMEDPIAMKCVLLSACTWTAYMGNFFVLPIFLQMAKGFSTMEAGLILFCRPLGGFFTSSFVSWYMRREGDGTDRPVRLHWVIRCGSASMTFAFLILFLFAHRVDDHDYIRAMVLVVLLMQAGGGVAVTVPSQAILVARMPSSRLASITSIMQMVGGVTAMVGMTLMLSSVRATWAPGDGEADPSSYRVVWSISGGLSIFVHLVSWTMKAGSQYKAVDQDDRDSASVYAGDDEMSAAPQRPGEKDSLLRPAQDSDSEDENS